MGAEPEPRLRRLLLRELKNADHRLSQRPSNGYRLPRRPPERGSRRPGRPGYLHGTQGAQRAHARDMVTRGASAGRRTPRWTNGWFELSGAKVSYPSLESGFKAPWVRAEETRLAEMTARNAHRSLMGTASTGAEAFQHFLRYGEWPTGAELGILVYESFLTLSLLEKGGEVLRLLQNRLVEWARKRRMGEFYERMQQLRVKKRRFRAGMDNLEHRPQAGPRDGPRLKEAYVSLLREMTQFAESLRSHSRISGDAREVEVSKLGLSRQKRRQPRSRRSSARTNRPCIPIPPRRSPCRISRHTTARPT